MKSFLLDLLSPFTDGSLVSKAIFTFACLMSTTIAVEAFLFLFVPEYSVGYHLFSSLAQMLGDEKYQMSVLLRMFGGFTILALALVFFFSVREVLVSIGRSAVFSCPGEDMDKLREVKQRKDQTLH